MDPVWALFFPPKKGSKKPKKVLICFRFLVPVFGYQKRFPFLEPTSVAIENHYVQDEWFHFLEPFSVPKIGPQKSTKSAGILEPSGSSKKASF